MTPLGIDPEHRADHADREWDRELLDEIEALLFGEALDASVCQRPNPWLPGRDSLGREAAIHDVSHHAMGLTVYLDEHARTREPPRRDAHCPQHPDDQGDLCAL